MKEYIGTGRRKTAVASVRLRSGSGKIDVNGKDFSVYFPLELQRKTILAPLEKSELTVNTIWLSALKVVVLKVK